MFSSFSFGFSKGSAESEGMKKPSEKPIVLVTVSGKDGPGITSSLMGILAQSKANILDIGQAVIHGLLSETILFELNPKDAADKTTIKDLLFKATEMGLKLEFQVIAQNDSILQERSEKSYRYAITLIGQTITAEALHEVTKTLARFHLNIDSIQRLSDKEFSCVEMLAHSTKALDRGEMKKELLAIALSLRVDIALQSEGLFRRSKRLVVMDMDSTLIQNEVIDELARQNHVYDEVAAITARAMNGDIDFDESLVERCKKLEGLSTKDIDTVFDLLKLTPGAEELILVLKKLGYKVALISGGFTCIAERLKTKLGIDYVYANKLEIKDGKVTGRVLPPIVNAQRKADLLDVIAQQEGIHSDQVVAIGDGANDLLMLEKAGLGIAFNAKPKVSEQADLALNQKNLRSIFYLLGISGRDLAEVLEVE